MVLGYLYQKQENPKEYQNYKKIIYTHTTLKGIQFGLTLAPFLALTRVIYDRDIFSFFRQNLKYCNKGIFWSVIGTNLLAYYKMKNSSIEKNYSRAWRLHRNQNQNKADNYVVLGLLIGGLGNIMLRLLIFEQVLFGGINFGGQIGLYFLYAEQLSLHLYDNSVFKEDEQILTKIDKIQPVESQEKIDLNEQIEKKEEYESHRFQRKYKS